MSLRRATAALGVAAVLFAAAAAEAAPEGWAPLLQPEALAGILDRAPETRVLQVTGAPDEGRLPGAVQAPYADWRGPPDNPGALRPIAHYADLLRRLGIDARTPVAVVHSGRDAADMGAAARVCWTLKSLGVRDLALLDGGLAGWRAAGLPLDAAPPAPPAPSDFAPRWDDRWRVGTAEVESLVASGAARLLDARPRGFFEGRLWTAARPGTLPGAGNLSCERWFDGARMVPAERVAEIAAEIDAEIDAGPTLTVSFCNTGHWAAINWFALSEVAGLPDVRLYAESLAEWTAAERPLANAPGRVAIYWAQTRAWARGLF